MPAWAGQHLIDGLVSIHTRSPCSLGGLHYATASPGTVTWSAANRAIYVPVRLSSPTVLTKVWWYNGTVVGPPNVDCGVYAAGDSGGLTLVVSSGSTVQGASTTVQAVDVTDVTLLPGLYYLALALDVNSSGIFLTASGTPAQNRAAGVVMQESAFPLPATATPVALPTGTTQVPLCGFTTRTVL